MCVRISAWLHKISSGWLVLGTLAIFFLFMILILPSQAAKADPAGSPDTSLYYSPAELYRLAEAYGPEGRRHYLRSRFSFDLIFPLVYAAFLATNISWLLRRTFPLQSWWQRLNLVPLWGAFFDYLENITASLVMWRYPVQVPIAATLAPLFTLVKWFFVGGGFLFLIVVGLVRLGQWLRSRAEG
mgnify:CR=1 FL=1